MLRSSQVHATCWLAMSNLLTAAFNVVGGSAVDPFAPQRLNVFLTCLPNMKDDFADPIIFFARNVAHYVLELMRFAATGCPPPPVPSVAASRSVVTS